MRNTLCAALLLSLWTQPAPTQSADATSKLEGLDAYMQKTRKDWNAPGIGVTVIVKDQVVFSKGYGYRDYEKKLPFTQRTMLQIASNTKLFTAVAAGMLVEEGKLTWDKPVRQSVPSVQFFDDQLNNTVTLRDMLSHRTGVTRHDSIWYKSDFSRQQLFERLKYLEPQEPLRQTFLYNNLMYAAVGQIIELQSGRSWEQFVRDRILTPLEMTSTGYTIADLQKKPEGAVPFTERRDSFDIYRLPYYEDIVGVAPCGAIVSNMEDMSHWLIALMNDGSYHGRQVLPHDVLKATLEPAIALPNTLGESKGYWESLNSVYGMGRWTASYRGHLVAYHGGDLPGFHSQVAFMPNDHVGVIVFVIGNHAAPLYNVVQNDVFERVLGMDLTPWSERMLDMRLKGKQADKEARAKAGFGQVKDTKPSHPLADYSGTYEHPAYGVLRIAVKDNQLQFDFHKIRMQMTHFHYDRFDTPDDEQDGQWSVNFRTNPEGEVDQAVMSLDEAEAVFTRKPEALDAALLAQLDGTYETPTGFKVRVAYNPVSGLSIIGPGQPPRKLIPQGGLRFRIPEFSDLIFEFVTENGRVTALKQRDPSGEFSFPRK